MTDALATLSQATTMLAEARTLPEVKQILDLAEAARTYARAAKLGQEATNHAAEIKLRAERRAGELLAQLERNNGGDRRSSEFQPGILNEYREVLEDNAIPPTTAHRWQTIATIPEPVFEEHIAVTVAANEELTTAGILREVANGKPHVANNSGNNEWYTPREFISAAREVMGDIDLDPASSADANEVVCAARYFTAEDNGLVQEWRGRVWMNPPYAAGLIGQFSDKLIQHFASGDITEAICLVNNATETAWFNSLVSQANAVVFPGSRVRFWKANGETGAPLQGQAILHFGCHRDEFVNVFGGFGWAAWIFNES